ncbi:type B 50S ribosomal protein L31 [Catenovulum sp. SM1970]|uniref:type B 50S ribosomal protein L31 n=1 Tax=Marinifaba aquimaris TaxID=2741323 RepID=UPI0015748CA1|nr:type B 50S ribosomal protein L31 [Marinifaba aquimaris]NTS75678.1 type B 50S ribosomal protein L31 [Marinifaba aquimaris]
MKQGIHPEYRDVAFHDTSVDQFIIVGSTLKTDKTIEVEGKTYPYVPLDISSHSHPFYTGKQKVAKQDGQVAKFNKRFARTKLKAAV